MIGWAFAVSMLLALLAFELVMFRYLSSGEPAVDSRARAEAPGGETPSDPGPSAAVVKSGTAEPARLCRKCGTANDAAPAVRFCHNCLGRLT